MDRHPTTDDQVEDLRERMRLLQGDRKANIDILEANKSANKEEAKRLREENKDLRLKLSHMHRGAATSGGLTDEAMEMKHLQSEVTRLRKSHDDCRTRGTSYKSQLQALKDSVKDLELEAAQPSREDSPLMRNIRVLENRLDKAMIKFNEAQSIKKTYEQIVRRLKEERVGFDNQLGALERTLDAKQKDHEELQLLSGDANHAREVASAELERVRAGYEEERRRRETELREKYQVAQLKKQMKERHERREKMKADIISDEMGDNSEEGIKKLNSVMSAGRMVTDHLEHRSRIDVFENAFRKIKEATGVSDVNEVIQKIVGQESTAENLLLLTRENASRIEALQHEREALKARIEEIKYNCPGEGHRRKLVDDHEEQLSNCMARLERLRGKHERLAKVLVSAKAGIQHLSDKLCSVAEEVGVEPIAMTDDTVVDVLEASERTLCEMKQAIRLNEFTTSTSSTNVNGAGSAALLTSTGGIRNPADDVGGMNASANGGVNFDEDHNLLHTRPFNQRIDLPGLGEDSENENSSDRDDGHDIDEEEFTRDKVKKAASELIGKRDKAKKAQKNKKR